MDSFEEWWAASQFHSFYGPIESAQERAARAAYEAGQASRDEEVAALNVRCEELKAALPLVREDTVVWPSIHDNVAALQASLAEALRNAEETEARLAATTPVIEAAERIKSFQYEEIEYPSRKPAAPYSENEFMERAFNDGLDYCAAIAEAALATYRAAVTKEEGK